MSLIVAAFGQAAHPEPLVDENIPIDGIVKVAIPVITGLLSQWLAWFLKRRGERLDKKAENRAEVLLKQYLEDSRRDRLLKGG